MAALALRQLTGLALGALPLAAGAHAPASAPQAGLGLQPWLWLLLAASALLYVRGLMTLWRNAGARRGIRPAQALRFGLGWLVLVIALLSPLDALAERSFAAHMVQHELLMVIAAPLLVLGRPLEAWAWALPRALTRAFAAAARPDAIHAAWRWLTEPVGAWCLHALVLWVWHLPVFFRAALAAEGVHAFQHACFLGSALAFWWSVAGRAGRRPGAIALASLFTTMLHTGALGALLTFAPTPWYGYSALEPVFGLTALEDQQLGGLVMWLPGSLAYLAAGLVVAARWLREAPPPPRTGDSPAAT